MPWKQPALACTCFKRCNFPAHAIYTQASIKCYLLKCLDNFSFIFIEFWEKLSAQSYHRLYSFAVKMLKAGHCSRRNKVRRDIMNVIEYDCQRILRVLCSRKTGILITLSRWDYSRSYAQEVSFLFYQGPESE